MATPYRQLRIDSATSTQDVARDAHRDVPVLVITPVQTEGRGRSGARWVSAPRALAVSLAFTAASDDLRPFSLMAAVAAVRALGSPRLKWPNDLLVGEAKVGGILVERSEGLVVVGLGVNLWWPDSPSGMSGLHVDDPGTGEHAEAGALWGAHMVGLVGSAGWPADEYRTLCTTLGREITWEPDGTGRAVDVDEDGGLVVETAGGRRTLHSGGVGHLR